MQPQEGIPHYYDVGQVEKIHVVINTAVVIERAPSHQCSNGLLLSASQVGF